MTRTHVRRFYLLVTAVLAGPACSDLATEPERRPAALRVVPDTVVVTAGESVQLGVQVLDEGGVPYAVLPAWAPPLWTNPDADAIALDPDGRATTLAAGETRPVVELAGLSAEAVVRANPTELGVDVAFSYITQSTQRQWGDVPLVAGRDGLLRVYIQGSGPNFFRPSVRATFLRGGEIAHSALLELEHSGLPETLDEGELALSYDAPVPGSVLAPGTELVVEVDPDGIVPSAPGSVLRVPAAGARALDVWEAPPFRVTMVPVDQSRNGLSSRLDDPAEVRDALRLTEDLYPFAEFDARAREPYLTEADLATEDGWFELIGEIALLRWSDGSDRYYYGGFRRPPGTPFLGLGFVPPHPSFVPVSIGVDHEPSTIAHELGHNMGLPHAPCGGPEHADPWYPYRDGVIGQYGWDRTREALQPPSARYDLMTYCDPIWISDYNYEKVLEYRDTSAVDAAFRDPALAPATSSADLAPPDGLTSGPAAAVDDVLVVRGAVRDGTVRLDAALEWTGRPVLPEGGRYRLEGWDADGVRLFDLAFEPSPLDHAGAGFLLALPAGVARPDRLDRLRVTGPEGSVERTRGARPAPAEVRLDRGGPTSAASRVALRGRWDAAAYPLAVVRDRATGRILALARSGRVEVPGRDPADVEVVLSDGVRSVPARVIR